MERGGIACGNWLNGCKMCVTTVDVNNYRTTCKVYNYSIEEIHIMGMMGGWGFGMNGGAWFLNIFFLILVTAGIVLLLVRFIGGGTWWRQKGDEESAMDILKKRYASGEISREEFEEKKKMIS